jgi:hypothetical protein
MKRFNYNKKNLDDLAKLYDVSDVSHNKHLNRNAVIQYKCGTCKKDNIKDYRYIPSSGFTCDDKKCDASKKNHIHKQVVDELINASTPIKIPIKYTKELLQKYLQKYDAKLLGDIPKYINRDIDIPFTCNCGKQDKKNFRHIVESSGAFCEDCTEHNKQNKIISTNLTVRGVKCVLQDPNVKAAGKATILTKWGVENISQHPVIKAVKIETCLSNYNVEHPAQHPEIKEQTRQTNLRLRGVEFPMQCPEVQEKTKQTNQANLGVDWPQQSLVCQQKSRETSIINYGVPHASQNPEHFHKQQKKSFLRKEYKMPNGEIRVIQGYEHFALDMLIKDGYTEKQIKTGSDVPSIPYKSTDGKDHVYHPDIYLLNEKEKKIIEVKSSWTYECKTDNIQEKAEATKKAGYSIEIWVFDDKGKRILRIIY